jgi:hypothetical protein
MATLHQHHTDDVDDQAAALAGWDQRYEQLGCGRFEGAVWQLVMRDGVLLREQTNRRLREQVKPPVGHVVMAIPLAVEGGSMFAGQPLGRESLMMISGNEESDVVSAGDLDLVGLSVHRSLIEALLSASDIDWLDRALRRRNLVLAPPAASAIRHMLLAVCVDAETQLDRLADPCCWRCAVKATPRRPACRVVPTPGCAWCAVPSTSCAKTCSMTSASPKSALPPTPAGARCSTASRSSCTPRRKPSCVRCG